MEPRGLIIIYTGNGKGKTTASLGQALRALGQGLKVCVIQFIKGKWPTGEAKFFASLNEKASFHTLGSGFTWNEEPEQTRKAASDAWQFARQTITDGKYDMVVLDELTYLIKYDLISEQEIIETLQAKPAGLHIVISGRDASDKLVEAADLVSEIQPVKHPYGSGVKAQKGIEF